MKKVTLVVLASILILTSCATKSDGPPKAEGSASDQAKIQEIVKNLSDTEGEEPDLQKDVPEGRSSASFEAPERVEIKIDGNPIRGNLSAPVTIIEFSDFQCPVCERFYREVSKEIKEKYVDTGEVKWVHMDFPLYSIHEYALGAAKAGECAGRQGKFWEMHDYLFEHQYSWQKSDIKGILTNAATELGINTNSFSTYYDSDETLEKVGTDFYTGKSLEVRGTPTFFINGKMVVGYKSFDEMSRLIEAELKQ